MRNSFERIVGVFGKSRITALAHNSKLSHVPLVRGTLVADMVANKSQAETEMQFESTVAPNEFTPRELSA
jgi:hypothetical protein